MLYIFVSNCNIRHSLKGHTVLVEPNRGPAQHHKVWLHCARRISSLFHHQSDELIQQTLKWSSWAKHVSRTLRIQWRSGPLLLASSQWAAVVLVTFQEPTVIQCGCTGHFPLADSKQTVFVQRSYRVDGEPHWRYRKLYMVAANALINNLQGNIPNYKIC